MQLDLSRFSPAERSTLQLRVLYEGAGYRKFRCSHFEEYSLYQQNERFLSDSQVITFTDLDGKLRAIKPDVTLSIAKNAQPTAGECKKYYYTEQICRPSRESHTFSEISQMGLECIGAVGAAEQAEVVRLALESLASLEVPTVLEVSHMGFVTALLDTLHVDAAARPRLLELLRDKNAHELHAAALQSGLDEAAANALTTILSLHGPFGTTLAAARSQCQCEAQRDALLELQSLQNELGDAGRGMQLDLSLAGDMEYYNGLVFSGYVAGVPRAVLKGGRYDLLAQRFTPGACALGFALYLDELERLSAPLPPVQQQGTERQWLNIALPKGRLGDKAYGLLAAAGYEANENYNETRKLVVENLEAGVRYFLVKPSDVAIYVEHGAADIGIVGKDILTESGADVYELLDTGMGKCRMCVAGPRNFVDDESRALRVATKFVNIARAHYESIGRDIDIIKLNGSHPGAFGCDRGYRGDRHHPERKQSGRTGRVHAHFGTVHCQQSQLQIQVRAADRTAEQDEGGACQMIRIFEFDALKPEEILNRDIRAEASVEATVDAIIADVRARGDAALKDYALKFDHAQLDELRVSQAEIDEAFEAAGEDFVTTLKMAAANIRAFHEHQVHKNFVMNDTPGIVLGQKYTPIEKAGVYVPGGTAAYPSTVLMDVIPAKVAGVKEIVMTTPAGPDGKVNPSILAAAVIAGIDKIFKTGGAQAVAALAYGTESIPAVDKIVGPGNIYVATAKRKVFGKVGIDMIAGPSEILVLADGSCNPAWVAADLLSQAEHDKLASPVLVTDSAELAKAVQAELEVQIPQLPRAAIARASVDTNGKIIVTDDMNKAIDAVNIIAPEHLEICVDDPFAVLNSVKNAGSIFLGKNVPEALGDYFAGPNPPLPTSGTARFSSPLGVDDFVKKSSFIYYTRDALGKVQSRIADFAEHEGLHAHAKSVTIRFEDQ